MGTTKKRTPRKCGFVRSDLTGIRFGRLVALSRIYMGKGKGAKWECICDCGKMSITLGASLTTGHTTSCGCYSIEVLNENRFIHGHSTSNNVSKEYQIWAGMKARCYNINSTSYPDYGGRGITVCEEWLNSFSNFFKFMGKKPYGCSLERDNNNGNYEPSNCRWATRKEQNRNQRRNRWIQYGSENMILKDWADRFGITSSSLFYYLSKYSFDKVYDLFS